MVEISQNEMTALEKSFDTYRGNMRTDPALLDAVEKAWDETASLRKSIGSISGEATAEGNIKAYAMTAL